MDTFETYTTTLPYHSRQRSSVVAGATLHSAIYPTAATPIHYTLLSFLSYIKTEKIPVLPPAIPEIRCGLGQGASFQVNGAEMPRDYYDILTDTLIPKGKIVAFKRPILSPEMEDPTGDRIRVLLNDLIYMHHPPLASHPNIVDLLGIGFEAEIPSTLNNAVPVAILECAELGNLAEVLELARKEDRALGFDDKLSLCLDVLYGLEILHACDIVHGDIKCENILVYDRVDEPHSYKGSTCDLVCKLTDFGVSRLPEGGVRLTGSRPWQAPECSRGAFFEIEEAKRTDVYSFGMLLWRVALDGDPFKLLGEFKGRTTKIRREKRNEALAKLKEDDQLVQHVCQSLALSEQLSRQQLEMLCEVVSITLVKESSRRELDIRRLIRLLSRDHWYESREPVAPARIPIDIDANLLDIEKWYHEFAKITPIVQSLIAKGYSQSVEGFDDEREEGAKEYRLSACYQLAFCYANGIGVAFDPEKSLELLALAANCGSEKAHKAHARIAEAFERPSIPFIDPFSPIHEPASYELTIESVSTGDAKSGLTSAQRARVFPKKDEGAAAAQSGLSFLEAAERCKYDVLTGLLKNRTKLSSSEDGVTPLHFISSWDLAKAQELIPQFIKADADINAVAASGPTIGGTPLMWSVHGDCVEHSKLLMENGADPLVSLENGNNALLVAAESHCVTHLRMMLMRVRPLDVHDQFLPLIQAALGGISRFTRLVRHGKEWRTAAEKTLRFLRDCYALYTEADDFIPVLIPCLESCVDKAYARMNTDVQMEAITSNEIFPSLLQGLLRRAILNFDKDLFEALLEYGVPIDGTFENKKTLLHFCAWVPDHSIAAHKFAARLVERGAEIDVKDGSGITPWMDAVLQRKWDLADLLTEAGADPLSTDNEGCNIMGLCIKAINVGSIKYLFKYSAKRDLFCNDSFLVNKKTKLSILQLAASLQLPRAHGMKLEVIGVILNVLGSFNLEPSQLHYRSSGFGPKILPNASALDIAAARGNVYAVKILVKKGAHTNGDGAQAIECAKNALTRSEAPDASMEKKNLERCIFILEKWDEDTHNVRKIADDWTNMRTIDESHIDLSWEMVFLDSKSKKTI
ncbi:hypothetical protein ACLMJK_008480 [Lecanora helva]